MSDPKVLLLLMSERLYEDIKFVAQQNPTQIVDDDGAKAYNSLLLRAKKAFVGQELLADFPEWAARTIKYKDALVVAGQFNALLNGLISHGIGGAASQPWAAQIEAYTAPAAAAPAGQMQRGTPVPAPAPRGSGPKPPPLPKDANEPTRPGEDDELYGPVSTPARRNDDGTIPFSLE